MKTLSIITINLNNLHGLKETMQSVLSQTFTDYEYIVIDGGSTDGSKEYIAEYSAKLKCSVSEKDSGIFNAQNKGIQHASGKYFLFLNSGDFLVNKNVLNEVFSNKITEDIVYGDMMIDYGNGKVVRGTQPEKITFEYMALTTVWHPVSFIKQDLFNKYGLYNEDFKIVSDYDFFLKTIIVNSCSTKYLPIVISRFNTQGIGSSKEFEEQHLAERKKAMLQYFSPAIIETAQKYNELIRSKPVLLADVLRKNKLLHGVVSGTFNFINKARKKLK